MKTTITPKERRSDGDRVFEVVAVDGDAVWVKNRFGEHWTYHRDIVASWPVVPEEPPLATTTFFCCATDDGRLDSSRTSLTPEGVDPPIDPTLHKHVVKVTVEYHGPAPIQAIRVEPNPVTVNGRLVDSFINFLRGEAKPEDFGEER